VTSRTGLTRGELLTVGAVVVLVAIAVAVLWPALMGRHPAEPAAPTQPGPSTFADRWIDNCRLRAERQG
jgi:hypothetical protein